MYLALKGVGQALTYRVIIDDLHMEEGVYRGWGGGDRSPN